MVHPVDTNRPSPVLPRRPAAAVARTDAHCRSGRTATALDDLAQLLGRQAAREAFFEPTQNDKDDDQCL